MPEVWYQTLWLDMQPAVKIIAGARGRPETCGGKVACTHTWLAAWRGCWYPCPRCWQRDKYSHPPCDGWHPVELGCGHSEWPPQSRCGGFHGPVNKQRRISLQFHSTNSTLTLHVQAFGSSTKDGLALFSGSHIWNFSLSSLLIIILLTIIKVKAKLSMCFYWAPRHEDVLGEWRYSSTHSLTSALHVGEWSASRPVRFTPSERVIIIK